MTAPETIYSCTLPSVTEHNINTLSAVLVPCAKHFDRNISPKKKMLQNDSAIGNYMDCDDIVWDTGDDAFNPWMNNNLFDRAYLRELGLLIDK